MTANTVKELKAYLETLPEDTVISVVEEIDDTPFLVPLRIDPLGTDVDANTEFNIHTRKGTTELVLGWTSYGYAEKYKKGK